MHEHIKGKFSDCQAYAACFIISQINLKDLPMKHMDTQWIYGQHAVEAALQNPDRNCLELYGLHENALTTLQPFTKNHPRLKAHVLDRQKMQALVGEDAVHQGVALKASLLPEYFIEMVLEDPDPHSLCLILDQVTDPHNLGAILRNAAAFGVKAVIIPERNSPSAASAVVAKVASGALEKVPVIRVVNLVRTMEELQQAGFWCMGLAEEGTKNLQAQDLTGRLVVAMGAEGDGLRRLTKDTCDFLLRLPTASNFSTLNVASATAVSLYEVRRQQGGLN